MMPEKIEVVIKVPATKRQNAPGLINGLNRLFPGKIIDGSFILRAEWGSGTLEFVKISSFRRNSKLLHVGVIGSSPERDPAVEYVRSEFGLNSANRWTEDSNSTDYNFNHN